MICFVCDTQYQDKVASNPIDSRLSKQWKISPSLRRLFDKREGYCCPNCWSNMRAESLGRAILKHFGLPDKKFDTFVNFANAKKLSVAEINSCHGLHKRLVNISKLAYSEYNPEDGEGKSKHEDILNLSYKDNTFDLVLHSETLEHVPNPEKALEECRRVLKKDGICIFSVPIILNRKTRQRIKIDKKTKKLNYIYEKSYHGFGRDDCLVWQEFGYDFVRDNGLRIIFADPRYQTYILGLTKNKNRRNQNLNYYQLMERLNILWEQVKVSFS